MIFALSPAAAVGVLRQRRKFRPWGEIEEYGRKNATYCDYDGGRSPSLLPLFKLGRRIGAKPLWVRYDATRRGYHVVTRWDRNFDPAEIVALQLLLGSDQSREAFNLARVIAGGDHGGQPQKRKAALWNILYRRKLLK